MFIPVLKRRIFEKKYTFRREIPAGLQVSVSRKDKVRKDSILASGELPTEKARIDLFSFFRGKRKNIRKHLNCVQGESVRKGDMLFLKKGNVVSKQKFCAAPCSGIVDLSEIDSGILRILDVSKELTLNVGIDGKVTTVIKDEYISVSCSVLKIKPFLMIGRTIQGELIRVDREDAEFGEELHNTVVFLTFKPSLDILRKLEMNGARGVILSGMDFLVFEKLKSSTVKNFSVVILDGFGKLDFDSMIFDDLVRNEGQLCLLDMKSEELILADFREEDVGKEGNKAFKKLEVGDKVKIFDFASFGSYGKVISLEGDDADVEVEKGKIVNVDINNLVLIE